MHGRRQARGWVIQGMQASFWPALNDTFTRICCAQDMLTVRLQTPQLVSACSTQELVTPYLRSARISSSQVLVCSPSSVKWGSQHLNILGERLFSLGLSKPGLGQPALPVNVAVLREAYDIVEDSLAGPQYTRISLLVPPLGNRLSRVGHNREGYRIRAVSSYHAPSRTLALGLIPQWGVRSS